ncbi:MAG: hypothetical protein IJY81_07925 [Lachnospiraceae bacterium]|nr:hypothetical protein [Lachnospiraceae bacterium]
MLNEYNEKLWPYVNDFKFKHPADAYSFISTYLQDERLEMAIHNMDDEEKEKITMCEVFDKLINDGIEQGTINTLILLVKDGTITVEKAASMASLTKTEFELRMNKVVN